MSLCTSIGVLWRAHGLCYERRCPEERYVWCDSWCSQPHNRAQPGEPPVPHACLPAVCYSSSALAMSATCQKNNIQVHAPMPRAFRHGYVNRAVLLRGTGNSAPPHRCEQRRRMHRLRCASEAPPSSPACSLTPSRVPAATLSHHVPF